MRLSIWHGTDHDGRKRMFKGQNHLSRLLRLLRIEQVVVEVGCCTRVGHALDPSMDWIGLGQDFEETLWIGLHWVR